MLMDNETAVMDNEIAAMDNEDIISTAALFQHWFLDRDYNSLKDLMEKFIKRLENHPTFSIKSTMQLKTKTFGMPRF